MLSLMVYSRGNNTALARYTPRGAPGPKDQRPRFTLLAQTLLHRTSKYIPSALMDLSAPFCRAEDTLKVTPAKRLWRNSWPPVMGTETEQRTEPPKTVRVAKWYFGGLAGAMAACCTHPLDLLKVVLQTKNQGAPGQKVGIYASSKNIFKSNGIIGFYNGLSASLLRQLTYSTTRFGLYEVVRLKIAKPGHNMSLFEKLGAGFVCGAAGGFVGTPADMINVRMQNDMKLPPEQRRNYKNAVDGLYQVLRKEGIPNLFNGASTATMRASVVSMGQISFYEQVKEMLLKTPYFEENMITHFTASFAAGAIATTLTQPLDVLKTRMMNAAPGEYKGLMDCILQTAKQGPMTFYKGYIPAFVRLGPHTILMWIFLEQMKQNFGVIRIVS